MSVSKVKVKNNPSLTLPTREGNHPRQIKLQW